MGAWAAVRPIGGEGRREGRDKRGGDSEKNDRRNGPTSRIGLPFALSPAALQSSSLNDSLMLLDPEPVTRRGILLVKVVFDDLKVIF